MKGAVKMERDYKQIEEEISQLVDQLKYIAINCQMSISINVSRFKQLKDYVYLITSDNNCGENYDTVSKYKNQTEGYEFEAIELIHKEEAK